VPWTVSMPMTWTMKRRAFRLNERIAAAYSTRSRVTGGTLYPAPVRPLLLAALLLACAPAPERTIDVGMLEYAFLPQRIEVKAGERVRFAVKNTGQMEHDFSGDQRGKALGLGHVHLRPGGSGSTDWTAPAQPGEVKVVCTVPGHEQLGMTATIAVVPR
jgi:uncharacterized cupredoxin-like copper-binding protein